MPALATAMAWLNNLSRQRARSTATRRALIFFVVLLKRTAVRSGGNAAEPNPLCASRPSVTSVSSVLLSTRLAADRNSIQRRGRARHIDIVRRGKTIEVVSAEYACALSRTRLAIRESRAET